MFAPINSIIHVVW